MPFFRRLMLTMGLGLLMVLAGCDSSPSSQQCYTKLYGTIQDQNCTYVQDKPSCYTNNIPVYVTICVQVTPPAAQGTKNGLREVL